MQITLPNLSLVVLIGPSGSGKSTFATKHFRPTEVLSSDTFRGLVADDRNDQSVTKDAFEALHFMAAKRLELGRLTVIDATNVQREARAPLVALARRYHCLPVAVVLDVAERVCVDRNAARTDRNFGPKVVRQQSSQLRRSLRGLRKEGFRHLFVLKSPEEIESAAVTRVPLYNDKRAETGTVRLHWRCAWLRRRTDIAINGAGLSAGAVCGRATVGRGRLCTSRRTQSGVCGRFGRSWPAGA